MEEMPRLGILDSGAGGLGVLSECLRLAHGVRFYYFADDAHAPYGSKGERDIAIDVRSGLEVLQRCGVRAAALACNTATAVCVEQMRRRFSFPVIGTEPAVRPAARAGCKHVLVLVTPRTRDTARFRALLARERGPAFTVAAPPRLASAVEAYAAGGPFPTLSDHLPEGTFDGVVLGCTHYTLVGEAIAAFYSAPVFDGNLGTARQLIAAAGRESCPRSGISDHRKGGMTTSDFSTCDCESFTKNEVIFLNSSKSNKNLCYEQTFFKRLMPKNVVIGKMDEKFF